MSKFVEVVKAHKGKVATAVLFVLGGLASVGYVVPAPVVEFVKSFVAP